MAKFSMNIRNGGPVTFITVELNKFKTQEADCQTDLEKLIYTMKTIHTVTEPIQFPKFWDEEWLQIAIDELDSRKMTPDEKASLEILIARNAVAVNAEKRRVEAEKRKIAEARESGEESGKESEKMGIIVKSLEEGMNTELIARIASVSVGFVEEVKERLSES